MKTKIIYISGSEVFEMADVRAAFDEVRTTLGLGNDTVLFGVPVDSDDALAANNSSDTAKCETIENICATEQVPEEFVDTVEEITIPTEIIEPVETSCEEEAPEEEIPTPEPEPEIQPETESEPTPAAEVAMPIKKSRGRPRKVVAVEETDAPAPVADSAPQSEKVIPILSVLASNVARAEEPAPIPATAEPEAESIIAVPEAEAAPEEEDITPEDATMATIEDMIADDAPEEPLEKTLEQLLESMTPLREDHIETGMAAAPQDSAATTPHIPESEMIQIDDADATLEQLAAEFADAEDNIPTPAPAPAQGKIGKLKNILPFKKARREDTGLMGDLFGWAGVAANDEDFTIPGFFTTAASKK